MTVTRQDYETLEHIKDALSGALLEKHPDALEKFTHTLGFGEKIALGAAKLRYEFAAAAKDVGYDVKARRLVEFCDRTVPGLVKVFGEAAVIGALPPEARNENVAALSQSLGGPRIADLIRKTL